MSDDPTLDLLLEDAKRLGMTPAEYEEAYGVILHNGHRPSAAAQRVRRHEVSGGHLGDEDLAYVRTRERRRGHRRLRDSWIREDEVGSGSRRPS